MRGLKTISEFLRHLLRYQIDERLNVPSGIVDCSNNCSNSWKQTRCSIDASKFRRQLMLSVVYLNCIPDEV